MKTWRHLLALCLVPLLVHCSDAPGNRPCFTGSVCDDGATCVRMGSEAFCMPECDFHSECAQDELCMVQRRRTTNPDFRYASACLAASLEPTAEGVACQERELEACEAEPGCSHYWGSRLDLEMRCLEEGTPVDCIGPNVVRFGADGIGENADGEVFYLGLAGGASAVTFIDHDVDHPLYSELFEVQPDVWEWPECEAVASE